MYYIAICEDDPLYQKQLQNLYLQCAKKVNVHIHIDLFSNGEDFLKTAFDIYHIVNLDIQLGGIDGISLSKIIRTKNTATTILFITAFDKFWPEGYKVNAFRYLLKPFSETEILQELEMLFSSLIKKHHFITITDKTEIEKIQVDQVAYLEISGRKTAIHTIAGNIYISSQKLDYWYIELSGFGFAYTHNSFIVNMNHVKKINNEQVILTNGMSICISQRKLHSFKKEFNLFLSKL